MISHKLPPYLGNDPLWKKYAELGYSKSGYVGFRNFVEAKLPGVKVEGTTASGLTLYFENEKDFILFALRWT